MNRYLLFIIVLITIQSVSAQEITSFVEGETLEYTFRDDAQETATILFPRNACISSFNLIATPSELIDVGALPIDAVLVTDISGSMAWNMDGQAGTSDPSRLDIAQEASRVLIENFIGSGLDNRLALVSYSTNSRLDLGFSDDTDALEATINSYSANGWTCISCGVASALRELENARDDAVKVIFLMTDGEANRRISSYSQTNHVYQSVSASPSVAEQETLQQVCDPNTGGVGFGYITHAIAFSRGAGLDFMRSVADCPGNDGDYYEGFTQEEIIEIYESLARFETRSSPRPQMTIAQDRVLRTDSAAFDPIPIDGSCTDCEDPFLAIQQELYECYADQISCEIPVSTWSTARGIVTLDDLTINYETTGIRATDEGFVCTMLPYCGDGNLDPGESCEPPGTATCDENCQIIGTPPPGALCGNLIHEPGEQCDDGPNNLAPGHDCGLAPGERCSFCTTECEWVTQFEPGDADTFTCGNGIPEPGEECDLGTRNGIVCMPGIDEGCEWCTDSSHPMGDCRIAFVPPTGVPPPNCGDGIVDTLEGEQCDPPQDICLPDYGGTCEYCSNLCLFVELDGGFCGDGLWQQEHEACDPLFEPHMGKCDSSCEWDGTEPPIVIDPETQDPYSGSIELELSTRRYFPPLRLKDYIRFDEVFGSNPNVEWQVVNEGGLGTDAPSIVLVNGRFGLTDVFDEEGVFDPVFEVTDPAGNTVELEFTLTVSSSIGEPPGEPNTRLMITKGTVTNGFFEEDLTGRIVTWGPYEIHVRVWQR